METIHRLPQPVIAKVDGIATAAGCQLVAACDLAVAADERAVRHARREDRAVLLDADGRRCRARSGASARCEMLLTGRPIDAATALDWGLVNRVVAGRRSSTTPSASWSTRSPPPAR